jgi:hypothetical protein
MMNSNQNQLLYSPARQSEELLEVNLMTNTLFFLKEICSLYLVLAPLLNICSLLSGLHIFRNDRMLIKEELRNYSEDSEINLKMMKMN